MKKHMLKIGAAFTVAVVLVFLGFKAQRAFGQAAVAYPNFTQATSQQPTTQTNVQLATIAVIFNGYVMPKQTGTNFNTGITVGDTNSFIQLSNPWGAGGLNGNIATNIPITFGFCSNNQVYAEIYNPWTNNMTLSNSLMRVKVESWQ